MINTGNVSLLTTPATAMQEQKLKELLQYLAANSPYYQRVYAERGIDISGINQLADMQLLPITTKDDLQQNNMDFLCVPPEKVIEYSTTSGTLGSPVTITLTENDLQRLANNEYNSFLLTESTAADTWQLMLTLDRQFMAGMAYYAGLRQMGAGVIRLGPGVPSLQLEILQRLKPTGIVAVPSFILKLINYAAANNIDINATSVKKALCIGENIRNADFSYNILGRKITDNWNIQLFSTYASTEMQTAFTECSHENGGHLQPDLLIIELLDDNDQPVGAETPGELTITTLGVEGMPLLRYKTGDICMYFDQPCACGRKTPRLSPILGRKKQMIKFKGTTLYPPALFDLLNEREEILDYVVEVYSNEVGLDEVSLYIIPADDSEECDHRIRAYLQARLRVSPHIKYVAADELQKIMFPETTRKALKFIARRV